MTLSKLIDAWVSVDSRSKLESEGSWSWFFSVFPSSRPCELNKDGTVPEDYWKQNKFLKTC